MRVLKLSEAKGIDAEFIYKKQGQYIAIITEREKNDFIGVGNLDI